MNTAILLSGGIGSRIDSLKPKQYISVDGQMIVTTTFLGLMANPFINRIRIVADRAWHKPIYEDISKALLMSNDSFMSEISYKTGWFRLGYKRIGFSFPGANRQLSIYNALCDMEDDTTSEDVVLIQDAVRPFTQQQTIMDCFSNISGHDGALPVLPMKDTVYLSEDGNTISSLIDRSKVYAGQAPEAYRYGKYKNANEALLPEEILKINGAAEPAIMYGMDVVMFPGDELNFKITTDEDLKRYREIVEKE